MRLRAILFDMDGTLLDSAPDFIDRPPASQPRSISAPPPLREAPVARSLLHRMTRICRRLYAPVRRMSTTTGIPYSGDGIPYGLWPTLRTWYAREVFASHPAGQVPARGCCNFASAAKWRRRNVLRAEYLPR